MFNKGDKIIVRHEDKNGQSQFSWVTRIFETEGDTCHIHEAVPNGHLVHDRNHIWTFDRDNLHLEYNNLKDGGKYA